MRPSRRHRRHGLAHLLAALLAGAFLAASAVTGATALAGATVAAAGDEPVDGPGNGWWRVPLGPAFADGDRLTDIVAAGPGFVAAGTSGPATVVWTSPDGLAWERSQLPLSLDFPTVRAPFVPDRVPEAPLVAAHGDRLVVLDADRRLWTSSDGRDWQALSAADAGLDPKPSGATGMTPGPLLDLVAGPSGFVAVGFADHGGLAVPQVALSEDGATWRMTRERDALVPRGDPYRYPLIGWSMPAVASTRDGLLGVVLRSRIARMGSAVDSDIILFRSSDGKAWRSGQPDALGGRGDQVPRAVAVAGGSAVIVGGMRRRSGRGDLAPAAWLGEAGSDRGWERASVEPPSEKGAAHSEMEDVAVIPAVGEPDGPAAAAGGGFAAVGWAEDADGVRPVAWHSQDGRRWSGVPVEQPERWPDARMLALASGPDRLVAVGTSFGGPAVWVSGVRPPNPAVPEPERVATPPPDGVPGPGWLALPDPEGAFHKARVDDVARVGQGFVAVGGYAYMGGPYPPSCRPLVWRSPDGRTWVRDRPGDVPAPAGPEPYYASGCGGWGIASGPAGAVIFTNSRRTWVIEPDGRLTAVSTERSGLRGGWARGRRDRLDPTWMGAVAATPDGFVAVGLGGWWHAYSTGSKGGMSWTSGDGRLWRAAPYHPATYRSCAFGVLAAHRDRLVSLAAGGSIEQLPGACLSSDGRRWTHAPVGVLADDQARLSDLVSDGSRLVAVGGVGGDGLILVSEDGSDWRRVTGAGLQGGAGGLTEVQAVARLADGWLAVGRVGPSDSSGSLATWRSEDGEAWERDDAAGMPPEAGRAMAVLELGDRLVIVTGSGVLIGALD